MSESTPPLTLMFRIEVSGTSGRRYRITHRNLWHCVEPWSDLNSSEWRAVLYKRWEGKRQNKDSIERLYAVKNPSIEQPVVCIHPSISVFSSLFDLSQNNLDRKLWYEYVVTTKSENSKIGVAYPGSRFWKYEGLSNYCSSLSNPKNWYTDNYTVTTWIPLNLNTTPNTNCL